MDSVSFMQISISIYITHPIKNISYTAEFTKFATSKKRFYLTECAIWTFLVLIVLK